MHIYRVKILLHGAPITQKLFGVEKFCGSDRLDATRDASKREREKERGVFILHFCSLKEFVPACQCAVLAVWDIDITWWRQIRGEIGCLTINVGFNVISEGSIQSMPGICVNGSSDPLITPLINLTNLAFFKCYIFVALHIACFPF